MISARRWDCIAEPVIGHSLSGAMHLKSAARLHSFWIVDLFAWSEPPADSEPAGGYRADDGLIIKQGANHRTPLLAFEFAMVGSMPKMIIAFRTDFM
jgi:hypothetical protein